MEIDDTIIVKVLAGEASEQEVRELNSWKSKSPDNEKQYEQIKLIWEKSSVTDRHSYDVDAAWDKVKFQSFQETKVIAIWNRPVFKMAAAIVLCLAVYWLVDVGSNSLEGVGTQEIAAVTSMEYTLPDGSDIKLEQGSILKYDLPFGENGIREIEVKGDAYVQVKNTGKALFRLKTEYTKIESQSSSFELRDSGDFHDVIVHKGALKVSTLYQGEQSRSFNGTSQSIVINPGEKVSLVLGDENVNLIKTPVDWYNDVENQMFVFNTLSFDKSIEILSKHFKQKILIDKKLSACHVSFHVMYNDLGTGLKNAAEKLGGSVQIENGNWKVSVLEGKDLNCP